MNTYIHYTDTKVLLMDWFVYIYFQLVDRLLHIHYQPNQDSHTNHH